MLVVRVLAAALVSATVSFLVVSAVGCGTDAIAVTDCRKIESARCRAGEACGIVEDVEACKRFYRDQCLHGLALDEPPATRTVNRCVETIELAGSCAAGAPDRAIEDCTAAPTTATTLTLVCDIVRSPEQTAECAFLVPDEEPPKKPDAAGTDSGNGNDAGIG